MASSSPTVDPSRPLPSGTVTLLFTDIEGSTRLWETQPTAMRAALARHDALLRHSIGAYDGHVFKTGGDAFCAAFHTAPDAIAAALEAQRALHQEPWPVAASLRVRMALHSGSVELRDGDYFGPSLNKVARLVAAAHGGQVLLSESAHDLCRDHMPPLTQAKPLGAHGLKDVERPEAVFQLSHRDLPSDFPPLRAQAPPPPDRDMPSIAVLPFVNMSRDEDNEYFADGLSEELLNVLAKIRGLRVASRTSAFSFKGKDVDIPTVARKLNVATVLEGSVRKSGNRVRITAQLIEVASDSHLWSETYDRQLDDIFAVQDDIAQSVVKQLQVTLMGARATSAAAVAEVRRAVAGRADNPQAFQLYLQGKFYGERATQTDTDKAIALFHEALAIEPDFPLAWVGMSLVQQLQAGYGFAPIDKGYEEARAAAQRALAMAPDLAEGHVAIGLLAQSYDRNWNAADASFRRALELAPGDVRALQAAAGLARILGHHQQAADLVQQTVARDPLSARAHRLAGNIHLMGGELEAAARAFAMAIDINPTGTLAYAFLAITRVLQQRFDEALSLAELETHDVFRNVALAVIHHATGRDHESANALQALIDGFAWTAAYQVAEVCAYRGEIDNAFEWLETAFRQNDPGVIYSGSDPFLVPLHADARWAPFIARLGFDRPPEMTAPLR